MKKYVFIFGLVLISFVFSNSSANAAPVCGASNDVWTPASVPWSTGGGRNFDMEQGYSIGLPPSGGQEWPFTFSDSCTTTAVHGARCEVSCISRTEYQDFASCPELQSRMTVCQSPANKVDYILPICGSWSGSGPTFTLSNSIDAPASGNSGESGIKVPGGSCTAPAGGTCTVDIYDNALNKTTCTSPTYPAQTYSCYGSDPLNSTICSGDDSGLIRSTAKSVVSACTVADKCEFTCNSGYSVSCDLGGCRCSAIPPVGVSCTASHSFTPANIGASESSSEWYNFTNWDTTKFDYTWRCVNPSFTRTGNLSQNNLTQTKSADGTIFIVGKTTNCTVTASPKAGVSGTGCSASASLTIGAPALSCSPATQTVAELQGANFSATGGAGTLRWSTSGSPYGSPMSGTGSTFWTSYGQCGNKTITVTDDGGQSASCALNVTGAACGGLCNNNGIQDNGETGVDCGGGNCPACGGTCPSGTYNPHYICGGSQTCQQVDTCGTNNGNCTSARIGMSCGAPQPQIGNIWVNSAPDSSWTITGPVNRSGAGDSAEYRGVPTGTYTLTPASGFIVDDAWQTLARGRTIVFNITGTPSALSCSSNRGTARTGENIDYTASGGSGNFSWSGGGNPATGGNLSSFSTSFATAGNYLVRVTRGVDTADCPAVVVSNPPTVSVSLSANPISGMIDLLSRITAVVGGTATGPINYQFWKDCEGASCGTPDATVDSDAVSEYVEFTYTVAQTNHPKVTVVREGLADSANAIVTSSPKKYACVSGSCSISASGAYNSLVSCADACKHSECAVPNSCISVSADPVTGIGGPNRCSSSCDCGDTSPACNPGGGSCNNNLVQDNGETGVDCGGGGCPACVGATKYSCSETSNSCQPAINGAYGDSTCDGKCVATYYSCSSGGCVADPAGQFTSSNCDNRCAVVYGRCSQAQLACVNTTDPAGLDCSADNNCGGTTPSRLECQGSACVVVSDPTGIGNQSGCSSVGQYCGGAGSCSLKVAPPLVSGGQSVKVSWDCVGAPQCSLTRKYEKPNSTTTILQGPSARTKGVYPGAEDPLEKPASSAVYTLSCTDSSANATARVRVSTLVECAPTDPTCKP